jgi:RNA polymerase sigma factor for flagellar operon FliA
METVEARTHRLQCPLTSVAPDQSLEQVFLKLLPHIDRVCRWLARRYGLRASEIEDFAQTVKLKFIENDYALLRRFEERSTLTTFATSVVTNAYHDYRNAAWGKWRPSAEARRLGPVAVALEECVHRDGFTFDEACERLATNHHFTVDRAELERIVERLPARVRRRHESDDALRTVPATEAADQSVKDGERRAVQQHIRAALHAVLATLPPEDAAILALRFKGNKKLSEIAIILGLPQKPLYNRVNGLFTRLRSDLERRGVPPAAVSDYFGEDA